VIGGWRKLHNERLHNIVRMIKSRRMNRAEYVACNGDKTSAFKVLVGNPEGKRPGLSADGKILLSIS
jgi:hypothetical protein